ncbi:MAG: NusG domain II-containing protein [Erysipelotrichaceae bacterium]|nr:NusG domain II-containing protein [Erysipelotrichaceae bacterium]MDD4643174.1 NusG domain II-containing protein [Erysipelotrichaceae bacterium]
MKKKEIIVLALILVFAVVMAAFVYFKRVPVGDKVLATVYHDDEVVLVFDIHEDAIYDLVGDYGELHIEVKDGEYRVFNVDCPNHDCEKIGWVQEGSPVPIVCLPNHIMIVQE